MKATYKMPEENLEAKDEEEIPYGYSKCEICGGLTEEGHAFCDECHFGFAIDDSISEIINNQ